MAKEGIPFFLFFILLAFIFYMFFLWILAIPFFVLSLFMIFFFRDPKRNITHGDGLILSPADGKIIEIKKIPDHPVLNKNTTVISIFLSLFNVHITRSPIKGVVEKIEEKSGTFFPAFKEKAQFSNSYSAVLIKGENVYIFVKQIAGIIARKIKCWIREKEQLKKGQKMGLIYFGSRVDIFMPENIILKVSINQKVKAGKTIIAEIKE